MVLEKLKEQKNFTETEKTIASYLLDPNHNLEGLTSSELARLAYTSQTSVVRLYKKLGLESYAKFYSQLLKEIIERKETQYIDRCQPIRMNMTTDEVIDTITKYYVNEIYDAKLSIDRNKIQRLYNHLRVANSVQIYGNGSATFVMKELSHKISTFGIHCSTIENINELRLMHFKTGERVAIIISLNDEISIIKEMALILKQENMYIFGILNNNKNPIEKLCNDVIYVGMPNNQNINHLSSVMYIVDIIYSMFLSHYNEK